MLLILVIYKLSTVFFPLQYILTLQRLEDFFYWQQILDLSKEFKLDLD